MEIRYRWERNHYYMLISADCVAADSYQLRMLEENQIYGLLKVRAQQINGQTELCYHITGRQLTGQRFGGVYLTESYIKRLMAEINKTASALEEYLLDLDSLLLEPEFIFWREQDDMPEFCYYPTDKPEKNFRERLRALLRYMLDKTDHKNEQTVALVYGMYQIGVKDYFQMQDFMKFLFYHEERFQNHFQSGGLWAEEKKGNTENPNHYIPEKRKKENSDLNTDNRGLSDPIQSGLTVRKYLWLDRVLALILVGLAAAAAAVLISRMYHTWENGETREQMIRVGLLFSVAIMTSAAVYRLLTAEHETNQNRVDEPEQNVPEREKSDNSERRQAEQKWLEYGQPGVEGLYGRRPDVMKLRESEENYFSDSSKDKTCVLNVRAFGEERIWFRYQGKENISDFMLERDGRFLVGKEEKGADIILNWPTVSRKQAILYVRGGICTVADCGSSNGTYLDEVRLTPERPKILLSGSVVRFAELSFLVEMNREDETRLLNGKDPILS